MSYLPTALTVRARRHTAHVGWRILHAVVLEHPVVRPASAFLAAVTVLNLGVQQDIPALRAGMVLPLALIVPGAACDFALFRSTRKPVGLPTIGWWPLLSLATYPLLALALQCTGYRLTRSNAYHATDLLILILAAIGTGRSALEVNTLPPHSPRDSDLHVTVAAFKSSIWTVSTVCGLVILAVIAVRLIPLHYSEPYTSLALDGARVSVKQHATHPTVRIPLLLTNDTEQSTGYTITAKIYGHRVLVKKLMRVQAGATWSGSIAENLPEDSCLRRAQITLSSSSRADIASLVLWIQSTPAKTSGCATGTEASGSMRIHAGDSGNPPGSSTGVATQRFAILRIRIHEAGVSATRCAGC